MGTNGSFYQNGLPLSSTETGLGPVPMSVVPKPANSSFYLSGTIYNTLANQDALLALLLADTSLVAADLVASNVAAANAAASAAAAATTLSNALTKPNNLSDLSSVPTALVNLGLNNVNNTSDALKPLSNADVAALALKAPLASPALTGVPVAPTAAALNNSTQLATTAYADAIGTLATAALALKAPLASPALTGAPTAPTATALDNSTKLATTAYADGAVSTLSGTVNTALALKAPLASPSFTGTVNSAGVLNANLGLSVSGAASNFGAQVNIAYASPALTLSDTGTSYAFTQWQNSGATNTMRVGSEQSTGGALLSGSSGLSGIVGTTVNQSLHLGTNNTVRMTITGAGAASFTGSLAVTGTTTLSSTLTYGGVTLSNSVTGTGSMALSASPTFTGVPTAPTATVGTNTTQLATTAFVLANAGAATPLQGYLFGLTLSTAGASTTFSVAAGAASDSTATVTSKLLSAISKTTGAWVVGTGNGAIDTGSIAASTWYHVYLIERTDLSVVDVLISLSATAPTMPANYTYKRRIGSMKTNGSSQWTSFVQLGDEFLWATPVNDVSTVALSTTSTLFTLASVPLGVQVRARLRGFMGNASASTDILLTSPDESTQVVATPAGNYTARNPTAGNAMFPVPDIRVNTSQQIRAVADAASTTLSLDTYGYFDDRGKLS